MRHALFRSRDVNIFITLSTDGQCGSSTVDRLELIHGTGTDHLRTTQNTLTRAEQTGNMATAAEMHGEMASVFTLPWFPSLLLSSFFLPCCFSFFTSLLVLVYFSHASSSLYFTISFPLPTFFLILFYFPSSYIPLFPIFLSSFILFFVFFLFLVSSLFHSPFYFTSTFLSQFISLYRFVLLLSLLHIQPDAQMRLTSHPVTCLSHFVGVQ